MTTPTITAEISLGHIIQVITLVILAGVGWGVHTTTVSAMQAEMAAHQTELGRHDSEIRIIDKANSVVMTELKNISATLQEVKMEVKKP